MYGGGVSLRISIEKMMLRESFGPALGRWYGRDVDLKENLRKQRISRGRNTRKTSRDGRQHSRLESSDR